MSFVKTEFTAEEKMHVAEVLQQLEELRSYAKRFDAGESLNNDELQVFVGHILEDVVPKSERLGMHHEQNELQDTCVRIAYPDDYQKLKCLLQDSEATCEMVFKTFSLPIRAMLDDLGIEYDFQYRMKSIYSIWRKMRIDHKEFDDVFDLFATRIVYKVPGQTLTAEGHAKLSWDVQHAPAVEGLRPEADIQALLDRGVDMEKLYCWRIYNVIAMLYRIHPDRIKDWVSHPKPSGYRALQMTVMGPDCNWIEIQLRSERMDYEAEHGSAAHWLYKGEKAVR